MVKELLGMQVLWMIIMTIPLDIKWSIEMNIKTNNLLHKKIKVPNYNRIIVSTI